MAHLSPAVYLIWSLLSTILGAFLVYHLWSFDRFQCLKWNHGPYSGAFKRIMTYSYLLSIPLIFIYSVGLTIIKYQYGFTKLAFYGILPTPYELWSKSAKAAIVPLYLSVSLAWALEMVTHLEELCFWLFLVYSSARRQDWFQSAYFKIWAVGSCTAVLAMPLITFLTRENVYTCEAYTFLAGGLASLSLTLWFLPVLFAFPAFLDHLRDHDVEPATMLRLNKFHELNYIRIVFRFLFTLPLVILGIDGVRPHHHINNNMLATDLLAIVAGIGCVVSSGLTLVIFFPRSLQGEMAIREQQRARKRTQSGESQAASQQSARPSIGESPVSFTIGCSTDACDYTRVGHTKSETDVSFGMGTDRYESPITYKPFTVSQSSGLPTYEVVMGRGDDGQRLGQERRSSKLEEVPAVKVPEAVRSESVGEEALGGRGTRGSVIGSVGSRMLQPNRRKENGDVELGGVLSADEVQSRARSRREQGVSEMVYQWRSPLEIGRPTVLP